MNEFPLSGRTASKQCLNSEWVLKFVGRVSFSWQVAPITASPSTNCTEMYPDENLAGGRCSDPVINRNSQEISTQDIIT